MFKLLRSHQPQPSDQELFQGLLSNDQQVLELIYRKVFPMVAGQVIRMRGTEEDARDIFQEGLVAVWQNARNGSFQLQENSRLSTYLVQVCKQRWMDHLKKASKQREFTVDEVKESTEPASVLHSWPEEENQRNFQQYFQQLNERCQEMLERFYFDRESMFIIAQAFGIEEKTAKNEKYRCMQRLKKIVHQAQQSNDGAG